MRVIFIGLAVLALAVLTVMPFSWASIAHAETITEMVLEAKAKKSGDPDDAMAAAQYHDKQKGKGADKQAMEWYGKAAEGYLKEKKPGKAEAAVAAMRKIDANHPNVAKLEARIAEAKGAADASPAASDSPKGKAAAATKPVAALPPEKPPAPIVPVKEIQKPLADGLAAWRKGDFALARAILPAYARNGDVNAQYALGSAIYNDLKGARTRYNQWSQADAQQWYQAAADQRHMGARYMLTLMALPQYNLNDINDAQRSAVGAGPDQWLPELKERAALKHVDAMRALSRAYRKGHGVPADATQAIKWAKDAAALGDPAAKLDLFAIYMSDQKDYPPSEFPNISSGVQSSGIWDPRDKVEAEKWLHDAAVQGLRRARFLSAFIRYRNRFFDEDYDRAFNEYVAVSDDADADTVKYLTYVTDGGTYLLDDPGAQYALGRIALAQKNASEAGRRFKLAVQFYARPYGCEVRKTAVAAKLPAALIADFDNVLKSGHPQGCSDVPPVPAMPNVFRQ